MTLLRLLGALCLFCCAQYAAAYTNMASAWRRRTTSSRLHSGSSSPLPESPELREFLAGPNNKRWKGTRDIMPRRNQVPKPEYSVHDVVRTCMAALQNNDDPQLDHGAAVVLEFKSPTGPLADGDLDAAAYGRFLRSDEYASLIDFKTCSIMGDPVPVGATNNSGVSVRQTVKVVDWQSSSTNKGERFFDFYLTQHQGCWLVDVVLKQ